MSQTELKLLSHRPSSVRANGGRIRTRWSGNKEEILIYGGEKEREMEHYFFTYKVLTLSSDGH